MLKSCVIVLACHSFQTESILKCKPCLGFFYLLRVLCVVFLFVCLGFVGLVFLFVCFGFVWGFLVLCFCFFF